MQESLLLDYPNYNDFILEKMRVVHPPQQILSELDTIDSKLINNDIIKFIFVGRDFYRKGGAEIILAFHELMLEGFVSKENVHVTLIGDYKRFFNEVFYEEQDDISFHNKILNLASSLNIFDLNDALPNNVVLNKIKQSHIGLLPTWRDTYGYSVLEFQSLGCPVISSNIRALPEINNSGCGWVFNAGVNNLGEIYILNHNDKENKRRLIIDGIKASVLSILNDKNQIKEKSHSALHRVKVHHDIDDYISKINSIMS